ncbi:MAG: tRNA (guanosine(46)-N7)-methyltransferase TrmB [Pseudonocardiales bacterium]|nr:tRNA (guanosine(46)-N7)-methyltransferase TrmB [Actinomycetota bacterium]PZS20371.1 MAG: tRNA (guanosine(46)-N7)-methyltransferase TrmB [Pseudonocardiales bacterium]
MTTGQQRAWDRSWDRWGADVTDLPDGPLDTAGWFGRTAPVVLEIGSGMGESTASMAMADPGVDHLAVEIYQPGLAQLLLRIEQTEIANLRLLRGDAYAVLSEHVAASSLHAVRIYFPDPWPKRRHHKRRLVRPEFITLAMSRLAVDATLHLTTDWEPYAQEMLAACVAEPGLRNTADPLHGFARRPDWRPVTKFEQRARDEGRVVRDLLFVRA